MTLSGVLTLCFAFVIFIGGTRANDCSNYVSADTLEVPENTECTLSSDLDKNEVIVHGTITITTSDLIVIRANIVDVHAGGKITADNLASGGTGRGNALGSGGSHGGRGGSAANNFLSVSDAPTYDSTSNTAEPGSAGGGSGAGLGGGTFDIYADALTINGMISANGGDATGSGGGGSGGSVYLEIGTLSGSGVISARGGDGSGDGGGGGGGRIAIVHTNALSFSGNIFADGGLGGSMQTTLVASGSSMSSSSSQSARPNSYGYLGTHSSYSWRPSTYAGSYLQMSLDSENYVTAIKTRGGSGYYVQTYTVRYYNSSSDSWFTIGDDNYLFSGNTDASSQVSRYLPWPLYTNKVRLYPVSYSGAPELSFQLLGYAPGTSETNPTGICTPATKGGSGGPGTIYYRMNENEAKLVINNYGKSPNLAMDPTCTAMDVLQQGAAAYVSDEDAVFNEIVINDGSHLVLSSNQNVTDVLGDGRSVLHLADDSNLDVNGKMTAHAHIYPGSSMKFHAVPEVELVGSIYVSGSLEMTNGPKQSLILAEPAALTFNTTEIMHLECETLDIKENAQLSINNIGPFILNSTNVVIGGEFIAEELDILGGTKSFIVESEGVVNFYPSTPSFYLGEEIDIRGQVNLEKHISIKKPCNQFLLEKGTLTWPETDDIIMLECEIVKINGVFSPGIVSTGTGIDQFTVGSSGTFTLTTDGPFQADTISIAGKMYVENIATIMSHLSLDGRVKEMTIHSPSGVLELNRENLPAQNYSEEINQTCNILKVKSLTIDKTFTANDLDIDNGMDDVTVNKDGTWTFNACNTFQIHTIYTNGTITSAGPLSLIGNGLDKVHEFYIEYGGKVTLDAEVQSSRNWTDVSLVGVHDFKVYGAFKAGWMKNYVTSGSTEEGWDKLEILVNGTFFFKPEGNFLIDYMYVNGHFEAYDTVNMTGTDADLIIHMGPKGKMKFDSLVTSDWSEESAVTASQIQMDVGSYWQTGNTKWNVQEALIAGSLYSYPSSDVIIVFFTVQSSGSVEFSRTSHFKGSGFNVNSGATMNIAYMKSPEDISQGSEPSTLLYKTVDIAGTLRAGSLYIGHLGDNVQFCENVYASGTIDVSSGGYLYDTGPGKGQINSNGASGASHAGRGGRGYSLASALLPHGTIFIESTWGSGGGSHTINGNNGGRGGGIIHIYVTQSIEISGILRANGASPSYQYAGGGSGGNIYLRSEDRFEFTGNIYCNGGSVSGRGGGGAGGWVHAYFRFADYHSGYVEAKGGSSSQGENGGPGVSYFEGSQISNLRVDNGCQQPQVTEPVGSNAGADEYETYLSTGAIAILDPPSDGYTFTFSHMELYGGAHLAFNGTGTKVVTQFMYGDDSGHLHIGPGQSFEQIEVSPYRRTNITYELFLYEGATWVLPESTVEFREVLDQDAHGMETSSTSCPASMLRSTSGHIWGVIDGSKAHLLISTGATLTLGTAGVRNNIFANLTVQDGGVLDLYTNYGDIDDVWILEVGKAGHTGQITIEAGGVIESANLRVHTGILKVDKLGTLTASGKGLRTGDGAGTVLAGASFGGFGGIGNSGEPGLTYGSVYNSHLMFGSGGGGATVTYGAGGGILDLDISQILVVEGTIESNGNIGYSSGIAGGSGGCILINTRDLEGSGSIQTSGGDGTTETGPGGGGRIAVYYKTTQFWFGSLDSRGGNSSRSIGGAGTVYLKDMVTDAQNETLIIDNYGLEHSESEIKDHTYGDVTSLAGRTWIADDTLQEMDTIRLVRNAHLAIDPSLTEDVFQLQAFMFEGDSSGTLHVGAGQLVIVQHPEDMEFLVNVYVYEDAKLILPTDFICYNTQMHIWGTIGVHDMTVGDGCSLYLGSTGSTTRTGVSSESGTFDFDEISVAAGGEITSTWDLTGANDVINIKARKLRVKGGGLVHSTKVNIEAENLIIDDLGKIIGDLHDIPCDAANRGQSGTIGTGACHAGPGGANTKNKLTCAPFGQAFEPKDRGCKGGDSSVSGNGGRGAGVIYLKVTSELQNDGEVSCNGEAGSGASGGASGGSILIDVANVKGYGHFQVTGGDGSTYGDYEGCGGSGGRIAMYFDSNFTYSGSWDIYGGDTSSPECDGASGTAFFYHNGYSHSTLLINNRGRGIAGESGVINDYNDLSEDTTHTWFLPHHGENNRFPTATNEYKFDELQIFGNAHLAVLTEPVDSHATIYFQNMIGDRTGAIHVGKNQELDLKRDKIDIPFNVHVYPDGLLGLAPDTYVQDINIFLNGSLAHIENLTLYQNGNLWLYQMGKTKDLDAGSYEFQNIHVKTGGYIHMITDPVDERGILFSTITTHIDGGGLIRGTHITFECENITIDAGGSMNADGLGYRITDTNTDDLGLYGPINPGRGLAPKSGAGHGGSGGRGEDEIVCGLPHDDVYSASQFGSSGGGDGGGRGAGLIRISATNTIHIDGELSANAEDGSTVLGQVSGGGSGGSIWMQTDRLTGFGLIQAAGGKGSFGDTKVQELVRSDGLERIRCDTIKKCIGSNCYDETTCTKTVCNSLESGATCTEVQVDELPVNEMRCYAGQDCSSGSCVPITECSYLCNNEERCNYADASCQTKEVCCTADFSDCCYDSIDLFLDRKTKNLQSKYICCHDHISYGEECCYDTGTVYDNEHGWLYNQTMCCHIEDSCSGSSCSREQICCAEGYGCESRTVSTWTTTTTTTTPASNTTNSSTEDPTTSTTTPPNVISDTTPIPTYTLLGDVVESSGGGGAGGRISILFERNFTFSEFRYLANGGLPGRECDECEAGGPGTVFLYHLKEEHRTLIIDNNGAPRPRDLYVNWNSKSQDCGRAWIMPISGKHSFATGTTGGYAYEFEELQIYGNGELAIEQPTEVNVAVDMNYDDRSLTGGVDNNDYNVIIFFKYMIGDRTGSVHVAEGQAMDLLTNMNREEMDLPFNTYTYPGSYLGLAPMTFVHGVEMHLSGILSNVENITLRQGGYLWLKHGGHTPQKRESSYKFDFVKIQDDSTLNATTDPIAEEGITFYLQGLTIEGGGIAHGTHITVNAENVTIDAGGQFTANGLGYRSMHSQSEHGSLSKHGTVNAGAPDIILGKGGGGGHGGSGGKQANATSRAGFSHGDTFQPENLGSSGGLGLYDLDGGAGGGTLWFNVTDTIFIDGIVSANGADAYFNGSGGGSGGAIWIHCNIIQGYGKITANGGSGSNYSLSTGSGGAGGRIAVYFKVNETMSSFRHQAYGGPAGGIESEHGGAGTVFAYNMLKDHTTLILDNNDQHPRDENNVIEDYSDLTHDSCRTWILPESGTNEFSDGKFSFSFNEVQISGAAHFAVLPHPVGTPVDIFFLYMIGDRTGTMHIGNNQIMDLERAEIDLPFNARVYAGGYLGLAPNTYVHDVTVWLHGELDHVENITLHHRGHLALKSGGRTTLAKADEYNFLWVTIRDNATISIITDPVSDPVSTFTVENKLNMEGGSHFYGTDIILIANDLTLDYGASLHADSLGYRPEDSQTSTVNRGLGTTDDDGSSGAGHGGTSGKGSGTTMTGQPYGNTFQPRESGSAGGGGWNVGGQGGGRLYITVSNLFQIDGEVRSNGGDGKAMSGGGGSGGSVLIDTFKFRGMGNITANGGSSFENGLGSAGAGGRIAIYLRENVTYWGTYQCHGGYASGNAESGGPGTVYIYHRDKDHSTLYVNNNKRTNSKEGNLVKTYSDLEEDRFKAWILPSSSDHRLARAIDDYRFNELQIFGNAHLAFMPDPYENGCNIHFLHMIGDRTGYVHIGPNQIMDLERDFLDTPFNSYVYENGYLGLAPETFLESVFLHIEGTVDHIHNLTLVQGGGLRLFKTGSTNDRDPRNYVIEGLTVIKADSYINCSNPNADSDSYDLTFGWIIIEGGGLIKGGNLHIKATDLTVDDGGFIDASNGGFLPGDGPGAGTWSILGSSGASHGGLGGRGGCGGYVTCRLERYPPYGSLYFPNEHGSGGEGANGGTGGGVIKMEVAHTLTVDGYIIANSENTKSVINDGASGGSGGSIQIWTHNFTGSHTGHIQALGGSGDLTSGGGGSGGRIALYHSRHDTIPYHRGYFDTHGGAPGTDAEAGASGTVYVQDDERSYTMLQVDNNGQEQIAEDTEIADEGSRVDLSSFTSDYSKETSFVTKEGHSVEVDQSIYNCYCYYDCGWYCPYINSPSFYRLHHLFDHTLRTSEKDYFMAESGSAKVTITLIEAMYITKVKVFPIVQHYTKFMVTGYTASGEAFPVTSNNYVEPSNYGTQGSYIDLPVHRQALKFEFDLLGSGATNSYVALSEIEIFYKASTSDLRMMHASHAGASTWIPATVGETFSFSEIYIKGHAHLAFDYDASQSQASIVAGNIVGDKTGYIHLLHNHDLTIESTDYDVPFNTYVYEESHATFPPRNFFYKTKLYAIKGKVSGMEDLYVFKDGLVSLDVDSSLATDHAPSTVSLKSLHVQEAGIFELWSDSPEKSFTIDATNVSIYGGGLFKVNTSLNMHVHHLLAVYSGGVFSFNGAGYQPAPITENQGPGPGQGSVLGGSGGGHGGSGGRGSGLTIVGIGYDSLYIPSLAGSAGGFGYLYGALYFGDNAWGNQLVYKTIGGAGGGAFSLISRHVDIDGLISANGNAPDDRFDTGAGGGAGGTIHILCEEIVGHGTLTANGWTRHPYG